MRKTVTKSIGKCIICFDQVDSFGTQVLQAMCITEGCVLGNPLDL